MDHVPCVRHLAIPLQPVPYYQNNGLHYSGPFAAFGSNLSMLRDNGACNAAAVSSLAQEWLFFGLMEEFFTVFSIPFNRDDFLQNGQAGCVLSTSALHDYLLALVAHEYMTRQKANPKRMRERYAHDQDIIRGSFLYRLYGGQALEENHPLQDVIRKVESLFVITKGGLAQFQKVDIHPAVWDGIVLTISALTGVVDVFFRPLALNHEEFKYALDFREFHLRSIADFRQSADWCPNERKVLAQFTNGQPEVVAFLSQLRRDDGNTHSHCTSLECVAHHVDGTYVTAHNTAVCTGEACNMIGYHPEKRDEPIFDSSSDLASVQTQAASEGPNSGSGFYVKAAAAGLRYGVENMLDELTKEVKALVFVDGELQSAKIPLTKSKISGSFGVPIKGWNLVAFSHVWSDGLGNRENNALPACQLQRLQDLANRLHSQRSHPVPFWIDTLMIPIVRTDLKEEEKQSANLRKRAAMRNMEWVYKGASKVLVLESTLFSLDAAGMTPEERGARIMTSTWSRRLWTLQEGCMKDRTFFQFRDGAMSWPALHREVLQAASISDWPKKHSRLPKHHPIRDLQKIPVVKYNGSKLTFNGTQLDIALPRYEAKEQLDKWLYRAINPIWSVVRSFLEDMSLEWSGGELRGEALTRCMRSMYYRNCTNKTDEGLVLASLLSAKPGAAANLFYQTERTHKSTEQPPADNLLEPDDSSDQGDQAASAIQVRPENRLRELFRGLEIVPVDILFVDHPRYQDKYCKWIPTSLLSVNAPEADLLRKSERLYTYVASTSRKANVVCKVSPKGLEIGLDGLRIQPQPTALKAPFRFTYCGTQFSIHLQESGTGRDITTRDAADWVLIPETTFASVPLQCKGVLVKVTSWYPRRPGGEAEFECLAVVTRLSPGEVATSNLPMVEVKQYEKTKASFKAAWKDFSNLSRNVLSDSVHGDDKWVIG